LLVALQKKGAVQSASALQAPAHWPPVQMPLRQVSGFVHAVPIGSPQRLSALQTPERHSVAALHGAPLR
jgi:hypothetical protein